MTLVSSQEFHRRHGRLKINGKIYEFLTYKDYLEFMSD